MRVLESNVFVMLPCDFTLSRMGNARFVRLGDPPTHSCDEGVWCVCVMWLGVA
jgi:hypothetical protein